ncbi:MAG: methyltransferase [Planctomycetales bacterium]|nr:methyltransferase [Planctomycetales bacterium]
MQIPITNDACQADDVVSVRNPLPTESLLIDALAPRVADWSIQRAIVVSPGRAQVAGFLTQSLPIISTIAWYQDLFSATQARKELDERVIVECSSDLPEGEVDLVAIPLLKRGEAELSRDLLQQAHQRLANGGYLAASVDNPKDQWLHGQMQRLLDKVTCHRTDGGCVYWGCKSNSTIKIKDFSCKFVFRGEDGTHLQAYSRPGVFSHRRVDVGARQLMRSADIEPGNNILDLGCGAGTVAIASAVQTDGRVFAVDSNARAIECTNVGAQLNDLQNITSILNADGQLTFPVDIDLVLANPPYYGNDAIAQHFVDVARRALRPGGALLVVTKRPRWYAEYFEDRFVDTAIFESSRYFIACGRKP